MTWSVPVANDARPIVIQGDVAAAIGQRHELHTALADLIDNSLGAGAGEVVIRLLLGGSRPIGIQVADNGKGMDGPAIDNALIMGATRSHTAGELGRFGIGLKSASLSQASAISVISCRGDSKPVGRLLKREGGSVTVGTLASQDAVDRWQRSRISGSGTAIEWLDMLHLPTSADPEELTRWTENQINELRVELGLRFHRLLGAGLNLTIVATDGGDGPEVPRRVEPLDPFNYRSSGAVGYPKTVIDRPGLTVVAHVWPGRTDAPEFRLGGQGSDRQGFFVYRNNRLLQAGGWNSVTTRPDLGLARIVVDMTGGVPGITINIEKAEVTFSADLRREIEQALRQKVDGLNFFDVAVSEHKRSRQRRRHPVQVVEPSGPLLSEIRGAYGAAVDFSEGAPVVVEWKRLPVDQLFWIDLPGRALHLNLEYNRAISGKSGHEASRAPFGATMMHLLLQRYFSLAYLSDTARQELAAWQQILLAAAKAQTRTPKSAEPARTLTPEIRRKVAKTLEPYVKWSGNLPPTCSEPALDRALAEVVAAEGPLLGRDAMRRLDRALGGQRLKDGPRSERLRKVLTRGVRAGRVAKIGDGRTEPDGWTLQVPGSSTIVLRTCGERTIETIPLIELAALVELVGWSPPLQEGEQRELLGLIGLKNLSSKAAARLNEIAV